MSLQYAAKHLASKGRGPDTTLVHMAPGEVESLQAIAKAHGGTLTTNPETGLPEAGFLSSILPIVAGAALGPAGFGLSAMQAGLAAGAIGTLATGSLQKGLMAGLGAYGGAGLMGGVVGAGAQNMNAAATQGILEANPGITAGEIGREMGTSGFVQPTIAPAANPATASIMEKANAGVRGMASEAGRDAFMQQVGGPKNLMKYGAAAAAPMLMAPPPKQEEYTGGGDNPFQYDYSANPTGAAPSTGSSESKYFDPRYTRKMADGGIADLFERARSAANGGQKEYTYVPVQYVAAAPRSTVRDPFSGMTGDSANAYRYLMGMEPLAGYTSNAGISAAAPATGTSGQFVRVPTGTAASGLSAASTSGSNNYDSGSGGDGPNQNELPSDDDALSGFLALNDNFSSVDVGPGPSASDTGVGTPGEGTPGANGPGDGTSADYARGGISSLVPGYAQGGYNLGDYSDGGRLLKGPGDGVSDSIPATIADKRPARLADGEFVVPARIVSELGNGSTEAGARKLYAMMDRVQKGRSKTVGKGKVAVNSRAEKHLPA